MRPRVDSASREDHTGRRASPWHRGEGIRYNRAWLTMRRALTAMMLGGGICSVGCERASVVTLLVAEPLRDDAGARADGAAPPRCREEPETSGEAILDEFYRDTGRERCVVLSVSADTGDVLPRYHAVRARRIAPPSPTVPPCLGSRGETLFDDLPETNYTLRLMVLDTDGLDGIQGVPLAVQNLQRGGDGAWPVATCFPWFNCARAQSARSVIAGPFEACLRADTPAVAVCSLGPSGGTTCPAPR